jgi:hypothetical protein
MIDCVRRIANSDAVIGLSLLEAGAGPPAQVVGRIKIQGVPDRLERSINSMTKCRKSFDEA